MSHGAGHHWLTAVAADIRALHAGIRRNAEQVARDAIEAGKLLIEAKAALPHGEWDAWLRENCDLSARTARRYMALARSDGQIDHVANLGLTAAANAIATDQLRFERIDRLRRKGWDHFVEAGRQYGKIRDTLGGEEQFRAWAADKPHLRYPDEALFWAEIASFTDAGGDLDALLARAPKVFHPFAGITEAEVAELRARLGLVEEEPA